MRVKHAIYIWLTGLVLTIICDLFKIMHWSFGLEIFIVSIIAVLLRVTGFIFFVYKFYKYPNNKDFLNS